MKLVASGANNALLITSLKISSSTLWVDSGVTLYAATGATSTIITVSGTGSGIFGEGTIDGQGQTGYWASPPGPTLIQATGSKFVMYKIHLQNAPGFHVKITGDHFVLWGNTLQTPSSNSGGLTPDSAHNTDGIDPGAGSSSATSYGYIVCNTISVGDDHIAIKGANGLVSNLVIAHNHFGAGHGMSIGSETGPGGVSNVQVYDLTVDGNVYPGASNGNANGIRIKSYQGAGGLVNQVTYQNICTRNLANPILLEPNYTAGSGTTGGGTPQFTNITIENFHDLTTTSVKPVVTLDGYDSSHESTVTLNNVVVDGSVTVKESNAVVTLTGGGANFTVPGATGSGTPSPISCTSWPAFPVTF